MCPSAPALQPGSNPGTWHSSSAVFSQVFPLLGACSAPEIFTSSSRKLHFVFHSCSGTAEKRALQRCLGYFCKSFQQHLCSQVSPLRDFFDVSSLLIAAPLLSYLKSTLSYFCAASCSLCTLSDPSSVVFPSGIMFCSCIVVWVRTLSFLPQKQHKPHFCCIGGFKINLMNIETSFWFSQVVEFSLVKFLSPWYTQNPELLHSGLFVPSAEPCELFLSLFTWNKPQTPQ